MTVTHVVTGNHHHNSVICFPVDCSEKSSQPISGWLSTQVTIVSVLSGVKLHRTITDHVSRKVLKI